MNTTPPTLRELVANRRSELNLSLRAAAEKSGGLISHGTINQIELGNHQVTNPDPDTLRGLALALDLPLSKVRAAAKVPATSPTRFELPRSADRLTESERRAVKQLVKALLELHGEKPDEG